MGNGALLGSKNQQQQRNNSSNLALFHTTLVSASQVSNRGVLLSLLYGSSDPFISAGAPKVINSFNFLNFLHFDGLERIPASANDIYELLYARIICLLFVLSTKESPWYLQMQR